jgi:hypothetical protein
MGNVQSTIVVCHVCAFWEHSENDDGRCRRHPPPAAGEVDEVAHWPLTHSRDSCGEGIPAAPGKIRYVRCASCDYWHSSPGGIEPMQRRDQPMTWWRQAGRCVRLAPLPSPEPGPRAHWSVTHVTDGCAEGKAKES